MTLTTAPTDGAEAVVDDAGATGEELSKLTLQEQVTATESEEGDSPACGNPKTLFRKGSGSFIRAHDLNIPSELKRGGPEVTSSKLHKSAQEQAGRRGPNKQVTQDLFFMDDNFKLTLDQLVELGFAEATDEGTRFVPGRETANTLRRRERQPSLKPPIDEEWPIRPWHAASPDPANLRDVLIWNGHVSAEGFGQDWPLVKARGIVPASPRDIAHFLWDSSNVSKYNNMSVGRMDGTVFQEDLDTRAEDSSYGFAGAAKVLRSYNKIKLVPRIVEMVSILHARQLESPMAPQGTYLIVNRSIWESDGEDENLDQNSGNAKTPLPAEVANNTLVRSEMLLGVQLLRPLDDGKACEMTTVTHAVVPGMNNKMLAKTAANVSAAKIIRDIQTAFMS